MSNITSVGDRIRHIVVPPGVIADPESGSPDWVCSRDFTKVA